MANKICSYVGKWQYLTREVWDKPEEEPTEIQAGFIIREHPTRTRFRVKCPRCGRRMWADTQFGHDADVMWRIPPHKRKQWWKRKQRRGGKDR